MGHSGDAQDSVGKGTRIPFELRNMFSDGGKTLKGFVDVCDCGIAVHFDGFATWHEIEGPRKLESAVIWIENFLNSPRVDLYTDIDDGEPLSYNFDNAVIPSS